MPLGGIGAGSICISADGCFRGFAIAAPGLRSMEEGKTPDCFVALRTETAHGVQIRIMRSSWKNAQAKAVTAPEQLRFRCHYPAAHFQIEDDAFPLQVYWTLFTPIIPFDYEASSLPAFFSSIRLVNRTDAPVNAAVIFNWDGDTGFHSQERVLRIAPAIIGEQDNPLKSAPINPQQAESLDADAGPKHNALVFLQESGESGLVDDHACLAMRRDGAFRLSLLQWDNRAVSATEQFWEHLAEGVFARDLRIYGEQPRCGAIIAECALDARQEQRGDFVFSWHCPSMEAAHPGACGAYLAHTRNALETAQKCLRHVRYFFRAVENWQHRLLTSSLPRWMRRGLAESMQAISVNADYTRDGRFCLHAREGHDVSRALDARIYASLGLLLFLPRLEDADLAAQIKAVENEADSTCHAERLAASLITAYRDYVFTKNLARLQEFYPALEQAMDVMLQNTKTGHVIPEDFGQRAETAATWCAALKAHALMARYLHLDAVSARSASAYEQANKEFNRRFWSNNAQCYLSQEDEQDCGYAGQLSGQWHADYLGLGGLLPHERVMKTLECAVRHATAPGNPMWELQLACLLLYRGKMKEGLSHAESAWRRIIESRPHNLPAPCATLSIWHVLYALQGLLYNAPDQHLRIAPHLPPGDSELNAPMFTPACLGQIQFKEQCSGRYKQQIKVHLNSLVTLNSIELRTPARVHHMAVRCLTADGDAAISFRVYPEDTGNRVVIIPQKANVPGPLRLQITEIDGNA